MASKKKPKNFTTVDRYETALQKAIQKAIWLPEGNDKTVYRKDLAPAVIQNKPLRKPDMKQYKPMNPNDPNLPKRAQIWSAKNRKKKNGSIQA